MRKTYYVLLNMCGDDPNKALGVYKSQNEAETAAVQLGRSYDFFIPLIIPWDLTEQDVQSLMKEVEVRQYVTD